MLISLNTKEIQDLEIHFIERLDDGADTRELLSILNQIKSLKESEKNKTRAQLNANAAKTYSL